MELEEKRDLFVEAVGGAVAPLLRALCRSSAANSRAAVAGGAASVYSALPVT